jgi:hypothetical protein
MIVYAQSSGRQSTNSGSWMPIPDLAITLPRSVRDSALLILNIPNPYAQGTHNPGGNFGLQVNGEVLSAFACFTYNQHRPRPDHAFRRDAAQQFRPYIGRGGVVQRARRHRAHRQPGDINRRHRLSRKARGAAGAAKLDRRRPGIMMPAGPAETRPAPRRSRPSRRAGCSPPHRPPPTATSRFRASP